MGSRAHAVQQIRGKGLTTPSSASKVYLRERMPRPLSVKSSSAPRACVMAPLFKAEIFLAMIVAVSVSVPVLVIQSDAPEALSVIAKDKPMHQADRGQLFLYGALCMPAREKSLQQMRMQADHTAGLHVPKFSPGTA